MSVKPRMAPSPNISDCNIYVQYRKTTGTFFGLNAYGFQGIPQNFVLNIIGWILMILLFSILRKKAWNYGRMALFERNDKIYVQTNVITVTDDVSDTSNSATSEEDLGADSKSINEEGLESSPIESEIIPELSQTRGHRPSCVQENDALPDEGLLNWIKVVWQITDEEYLEKSGIDCVQYLSFQRHLLVLAVIIAISSVGIILPLNVYGGKLNGNFSGFGFIHTTILNVDQNHRHYLWVHSVMAVTFFILAIIAMRHFYASLKAEDNSVVYSSLMITNLSRNICHEEIIREHFSEAYPNAVITEVNFAYDISDLKQMEFQRLAATSAKKYWLKYYYDKQVRPVMRPYICGTVCFCCGNKCGCKETDAIDFYKSQELLFLKEENAERRKALSKPLGMVFITFSSAKMVARIWRDYRFLPKCVQRTPRSSLTKKLNSRCWNVNYAPLPEDLYWENLAYSNIYWHMKFIIINVILLVVVCFYTTPVFLLKNLPIPKTPPPRSSNKYDYSTSAFVGLLMDTLPTLLLVIFAVTLPNLVSVTDYFVQFWTKTAENRSKMIKIYSYLILMVIILPSLGLTSIAVILQTNQADKARIECLFSTENGALFVNYLVTSSFLGTTSELLRIPELLEYGVKVILSRSPAENPSIRQSVIIEFELGAQYAWMMLNFTIFALFSLVFPVISPFGIVYILLKQFVDRYNIYFAYGRTKVAKEVHTTAINFLIVCMFLLQPMIVSLLTLSAPDDSNTDDDITQWLLVFSVISLCITASIFIGQVFFSMVVGTSPIPYYGISKNKKSCAVSTASCNQGVTEHGTEDGCRLVHMESRGETRITMGRYFPRILRPEKANHNDFSLVPVKCHGTVKHEEVKLNEAPFEIISSSAESIAASSQPSEVVVSNKPKDVG